MRGVRGHILAKSAKNFRPKFTFFLLFCFFFWTTSFASSLACAWCVRAHSNQIENTAQYSNCMKIIHVNWMNRYVQYVTNISIHVSHFDVTGFFFSALCVSVRAVCVVYPLFFAFCTFWNNSGRFRRCWNSIHRVLQMTEATKSQVSLCFHGSTSQFYHNNNEK